MKSKTNTAKKRKKKINSKLRREIEILRAQLKSTSRVENSLTKAKTSEIHNSTSTEVAPSSPIKGIVVDDNLVKRDIIKTLILSAIAFGIIIGLTRIR